MSYIVIKVYSFECDMTDCFETEEVQPSTAGWRAAERDLRQRGWRITAGQHICPKHGERP